MNIREALVTMVDAIADLHGADDAGNPLHTARCIVRAKADRMAARQEARLKREARRRDLLLAAKNAKRDAKWDAWDRQFAKGVWDTKNKVFAANRFGPETLGGRYPSKSLLEAACA